MIVLINWLLKCSCPIKLAQLKMCEGGVCCPYDIVLLIYNITNYKNFDFDSLETLVDAFTFSI